MDNSGLLFIPDISGFTKFVNETEIEHSRYIISELLENIISSNHIGLTISEIEGDAVLFYRYGSKPSLQEFYEQVEKMFCNFQKQIKNYEVRRACQCSACIAAINLSLKIITHYGEFSSYNVNTYSKLIGKDVIVAHQLLKNDINLHEYWLMTSDLFSSLNQQSQIPQWLKWQQGNKQTDEGAVNFQYSMLTELKDKVIPDAKFDYELPANDRIKFVSQHKIIDSSPINILSIVGNLSLRAKWLEGVQEVSQASHPINHVGVKHRWIYQNRAMIFYASSFHEDQGMYTYSETDEPKTMSIYFTIQPQHANKTLVTIEYYFNKNPVRQLYSFLFLKKKLNKQLAKSLNNLEALSHEPGVGYGA